jgi:hypothetical protein
MGDAPLSSVIAASFAAAEALAPAAVIGSSTALSRPAAQAAPEIARSNEERRPVVMGLEPGTEWSVFMRTMALLVMSRSLGRSGLIVVGLAHCPA